jgi:hypothetical protein
MDNSFNRMLAAVFFAASVSLALVSAFGFGKFIPSIQWQRLLFLSIVIVGPLVEILFMVAPYRQTERYFVPFWPLVFVLIGAMISLLVSVLTKQGYAGRFLGTRSWQSLIVVVPVGVLATFTSATALSAELNQPSYGPAFYYLRQQIQPDDVIVTPFTAAAALYLGRVDYFPSDARNSASVLNVDDRSVDRYLGAPWMNSGRMLQTILQENSRVWMIMDDGIYQYYYPGDWKYVTHYNMSAASSGEGATVYINRSEIIPLPAEPDHLLQSNLSDAVALTGYSSMLVENNYRLFLFWEVLAPVPQNLTQFVHVRNGANDTVAQIDSQPIGGTYPTTQWRPGETVVDVLDIPIPADIPPGEYKILAGLYDWKTLERLVVVDDESGENAVLVDTIRFD